MEIRRGGVVASLGAQKQRALLAVLLLHANEVVSTDRLIDALWGERPPATAAKALQVYISQLRKTLAAEGNGTALVTRPPGYALQVEPDCVDVLRFESLAARGREALDAGNPEQAAELLGNALELWRGPALADLAYEPFAGQHVVRLEEQRLAALEDHSDAELALGRHAALIGDLETLVAEHPFRERLCGQLMVALYRSGRQAEALGVYQRARRRLIDELGLEPGEQLKQLEQAILQHEPGLAPPAAPEAPTRPEQPERTSVSLLEQPRVLLAAALLALLLAATSALLVFTRGGDQDEATAIAAPDAVTAIDLDTTQIALTVGLGSAPARVEVGGPKIWVATDAGTIAALDGRTGSPSDVVATGGFASDLDVGEGAVWVMDGKRGVVHEVDPVYGTVTDSVGVQLPNPFYDISRESIDPTSIAAGGGAVWITNGTSEVARVDPRTHKVVRIDLAAQLSGIAVGPAGIWAISGASAEAVRLDRRGRVRVRIPIASRPGFESPYPLQVAVGERHVWVLNANTATVTRINPAQRVVEATIPIGVERGPVRIAAGPGAAWVANRDGTLSGIDARTTEVTTTWVGAALRDVAVAGRRVWVTTGNRLSERPSTRADAASGIEALPASFCSPIYYGSERPQYLIASDLELQHGARGAQLSQAIQYVLRQREFRAGRYAIGYQSCDVSIADVVGPTPQKCGANARAYAQNPRLIGVIGSLTSICSAVELPILNEAPQGPLAMISFSNTHVGLTRAGPGTEPGEPASYYPSGRRNYVRVIAADDIQAAANATLARRLRVERVFLLYGSEFPGGVGVASEFEEAAAKLGIDVVGRQVVSSFGDYAGLANRIARSNADAVFISWYLEPETAALIRTLRERLGAGVKLLTTDGFSDFARLVKLEGRAAEGVMVSVPGIPNAYLPSAGKRFVAAFGREVGETPVAFAALAAQATEVLLDAIARSDGSRASISEELFETKIEDGVVGDFSIDRHGDTTAGAVTIYRIERGRPVVLTVITPRPSLVR